MGVKKTITRKDQKIAKKALKNWERIMAHLCSDRGEEMFHRESCGFCREYHGIGECKGCPVQALDTDCGEDSLFDAYIRTTEEFACADCELNYRVCAKCDFCERSVNVGQSIIAVENIIELLKRIING